LHFISDLSSSAGSNSNTNNLFFFFCPVLVTPQLLSRNESYLLFVNVNQRSQQQQPNRRSEEIKFITNSSKQLIIFIPLRVEKLFN